MKTYTLSRWSTAAAHPDQTDVTVEISTTLAPGFKSKQLVGFMVPGRFDAPSIEFFAAVQTVLQTAGLADAVIEDPLQLAGATKWAEIKAERDRLEAAGFPYMGKVIDSDALSVQRLSVSVLEALAAQSTGAPFSREWTCADYSTLTLDAAAMIGVPGALAAYADTLHHTARALYAAIEASTTVEEVQAIAWPAEGGGADA